MGQTDTDKPRVLVVQMGARHNYAVPAIFERAGMLGAFYTDMCAGRGLGRVAPWLGGALPSKQLRALSDRRPPAAVLAKTKTFDRVAVEHAWKWRGARTIEDQFLVTLKTYQAFGKALVRQGFGDATHIFNIFGEGGEFLAKAKQAGLKVITDVIIALSAERIVLEEYQAFPDWGEKPLDQKAIMGPDYIPERRMLEVTDLFVCPSEFVRQDLVLHYGVDVEQTCVVPYAVADHWFEIEPQPEPGRILFVGTADLRKGIHYLAMAAEDLKNRYPSYEFRVAGGVSSVIRKKPQCQALKFLGRVPRGEIQREFAKADMLVLPSLAEGSATVIYEALAAGVPVVTTRAAGSVVRHGVDGMIVEERNAKALADAIVSIASNRRRRDEMSLAARERAREFGWTQYAERLLGNLNRIHTRCD